MNVLKYWAKCSKGKVFTEETGGHRRLIQQVNQIQEWTWQKTKVKPKTILTNIRKNARSEAAKLEAGLENDAGRMQVSGGTETAGDV